MKAAGETSVPLMITLQRGWKSGGGGKEKKSDILFDGISSTRRTLRSISAPIRALTPVFFLRGRTPTSMIMFGDVLLPRDIVLVGNLFLPLVTTSLPSCCMNRWAGSDCLFSAQPSLYDCGPTHLILAVQGLPQHPLD